MRTVTIPRDEAVISLIDDGLLDLTIVPAMEGPAYLDTFAQLLRDGAAGIQASLVTTRSAWIAYESESEINVSLDGEPLLFKCFQIKVRKRSTSSAPRRKRAAVRRPKRLGHCFPKDITCLNGQGVPTNKYESAACRILARYTPPTLQQNLRLSAGGRQWPAPTS